MGAFLSLRRDAAHASLLLIAASPRARAAALTQNLRVQLTRDGCGWWLPRGVGTVPRNKMPSACFVFCQNVINALFVLEQPLLHSVFVYSYTRWLWLVAA